MTENSTSEPIDHHDDIEPAGTAAGDPTGGVEISDEEKEVAVEPEDNSALEVDGPQAGHA